MRGPSPSLACTQSVQPFLVLILCICCQIVGGTLFWYPAIAPGIQRALDFSTSQIALVILIGASGPYACVFGGVFHHAYGNRISASFGALGLSAVFLLLAILTSVPHFFSATAILPLVLLLTYLIVVFSFIVYASSISACASIFPPEYRGRVVGLCACAYGGSGGAFSAFQSAFLPKYTQTPLMLLIASAFCCGTGIGTALSFPKYTNHDQNSMYISDEHRTLNPSSTGPYRDHISKRLSRGYKLMLICFLGLQAAAVADVFHLSKVMTAIGAITVVVSLGLLWELPLNSGLRILPETNTPAGTSGGLEEGSADSDRVGEPSLFDILRDPRYIFILYCAVVFVGGGGITLLVQLPFVLESQWKTDGYGGVWNGLGSDVVIRTLVLIFSACSMGTRLGIGAAGDRGETAVDRHLWNYRLFLYSIGLMTVALLLVAYTSQISITVGMGLAGMAWGSYFVLEPAFLTTWFGTRSFARNACGENLLQSLAAVILGNRLPDWGRHTFGTWESIQSSRGFSERICVGRACVMPVFGILSGLCLSAILFGLLLYRHVQRKAATWLF